MNSINRFVQFILGARDRDGIGMGWVFSICGLTFPIIALWNSRAVVPFIALMTICAIGIIARRGLIRSFLKWDLWLLIGICGLMAAIVNGAFHVADAKEAVVSVSKVFANALLAISFIKAATFLTRQEILSAARCVTISTFAVGAFLFSDILSNGTLSFIFTNMMYQPLYKFFWFKSASSTFAICSLISGFYLVLNKQYWSAATLIAVSIFVQVGIGNRTAAGGLATALVCGLGYHWLNRIRLKVLTAVTVILFLAPIYILAMGFSAEKISQRVNVHTTATMSLSATMSLVYRMHAWEFVLNRINERPIIGWGLDGSKEFGGESSQVVVDSVVGPLGEPVPSHPHNGVLEVWLELGLFGALFVLILIVRGASIFERRCHNATSRIWTFSILTLLTCFFTFSYSAFSSAWIANIIFALSLTYPLSQLGDTGRPISGRDGIKKN